MGGLFPNCDMLFSVDIENVANKTKTKFVGFKKRLFNKNRKNKEWL